MLIKNPTAVLWLILTVIFSVSCNKDVSQEQTPKRPNIIFIMSDDHAVKAISSYSDELIETPNIDRLADEGMIFDRSYVTNSICGPSRAVLLTGKFSHLNGFRDNSDVFDGSQQTFPKILKEAGYRTAIVGKWHLRSAPTGFDYWTVLPDQGDYYYPEFITMGDKKREDGYVTDLITDKAIGWMDSIKNTNEPFMLMIHHKGPHRTWMPAIRHLNMYKGKTFPEPSTLFDDYESRENTAGNQDLSIEKTLLDNYDLFLGIGMDESGKWGDNYLNLMSSLMTPEEIQAYEEAYRDENEAFHKNPPKGEDLIRWKYQRYMRNYLSVVAGVDENIGRINDYLKENNLDENTIVVYTSDQGFYLGEHGWFDKRWMYEESFRMPLVVKYPPMVKASTRSTQLVQNVDFAPTLLELAGVNIPDDMQGRSLIPVLKDEEPQEWRNSLYYHYYEYPAVHMVKRHYGISKDNFKLVHYYYDIDKWEMYDLSSDPNELENIYDNPEYENIQKQLHEDLIALQKQYGDTVAASFDPPKPIHIEHAAKNASYSLSREPGNPYQGDFTKDLTDGVSNVINTEYFKPKQNDFIGFYHDSKISIDLGSEKSISSVEIYILDKPASWIHPPQQVNIYVNDGDEAIASYNHTPSTKIKKTVRFDFETLTTDKVIVEIKPISEIPAGNPGEGRPGWAFIDEIVVN